VSRVFVVEDEMHLAQGLQFNLEADGHEVKVFETAEAAWQMLANDPQSADLIVLDVMLPGKDGFWLASELRRKKNYVPVLMLTARGRPEDVLKGFESGTDDYLPKPFELSILLARVNGLLRRTQWMQRSAPSGTPEPPKNGMPDVVTFNGRKIDFGALELTARKQKTRLTLMEAELLRYLIKNEGRAVSRKQILDEVWGLREDTDTRAIDNFIVRLRRYLEEQPSTPKHLLTVRGVGYRFVSEPESK
jgi:two-component system, OmpR family, alkaline phosphatase synthesis response regulator PhoP